MENMDCILLSNDEHFTFFHMLAEGDSFGEFEWVALYPLTFGWTLIILVLLDFLQSDKEKAIVEGVV